MKVKDTFGFTILAITLMLFGLNYGADAQEQSGLREQADKLYREYQYAKATVIYLKLADSKKPKLHDMENLAESYSKMNRYEDAETWYSRVIADPESKPESLITYGEVLKANAHYAEAKKAFQRYAAKTGDSKSVANDIAGCDSAQVWLSSPTSHKLINEKAVNTGLSEFAVFPLGNKVYYAGEPNFGTSGKRYSWTGNPFLRVYTAERSVDNTLSMPMISDQKINSESYHTGPAASNKAGDVLYITHTYSGKKGGIFKEDRRSYRTRKLELYISHKLNGQWQPPVPFAYNNVKEYSLGHAALSADEKILYFVSDMPGGQGGTDIWYSVLQADGNWDKPVNAGPTINTSGNEMFPAIAEDGTLYYSSDGLPGMGGLDIFQTKREGSKWEFPQNMKYPVNSAGDDFAFINEKNGNGMTGYLSSNRQGGIGGDDIYSFSYQKPKFILALKGIAYNKKTGEKLSEAGVTLFSGGRVLAAKQNSKKEGTFFFELDKATDYAVLAQKEGYYANSSKLSTKGIIKSDTLELSLYLEPLLEKGKTFRLENIFYSFNKDNIRPDAAKILDELVRTLRNNPTLKIELSSHTDSRGSDVYNQDLSQRRAQSAVNYLVSRGISRDRMLAKGYGESRLLNECSNGVKCTPEAHQLNRRTTFTVLGF